MVEVASEVEEEAVAAAAHMVEEDHTVSLTHMLSDILHAGMCCPAKEALPPMLEACVWWFVATCLQCLFWSCVSMWCGSAEMWLRLMFCLLCVLLTMYSHTSLG